MSTFKIALAAAALACGTWAQAADVSQAPQALDLSSGIASFGRMFGSGNASDTFTDRYDFTASAGQSLQSFVASFTMPPSPGLDITDFSLTGGSGPAAAGNKVFQGPLDLWTVQTGALTPGTYHLTISGQLLGGPTSYSGAAALATAVPEPATYGMLLGGLGVVAWLARRRQRGGGAS